MLRRREALCTALDRDLPDADGKQCGPMVLSLSVPHGEPVSLILAWRPNIVLVGGPPLYLPWLSLEQRERAWENALQLVSEVDTLILDHHLLRSEEGFSWLERLSSETSHRVICAADYMGYPRCPLEAWRTQLYEEMPVPEGWHEAYAHGDADTSAYKDFTRTLAPNGEGQPLYSKPAR